MDVDQVLDDFKLYEKTMLRKEFLNDVKKIGRWIKNVFGNSGKGWGFQKA